MAMLLTARVKKDELKSLRRSSVPDKEEGAGWIKMASLFRFKVTKHAILRVGSAGRSLLGTGHSSYSFFRRGSALHLSTMDMRILDAELHRKNSTIE